MSKALPVSSCQGPPFRPVRSLFADLTWSGQESPHQYCSGPHSTHSTRQPESHSTRPYGSEKDFLCELCGKRFSQKGNLKTHIRSVHTKEKPFACPICGKSFSQKGNMQTHVRTHNKQHRYPCTLCGKTYSQKGNLKTHLQRHEDRTGQVTSPLCEPASDALATLSSDDDSCHSPPRHAPDAQSHPGPAGRGDNPACALPSPPAHCWPAHKTTQRNPVDMTSHSPYHSLSSLATQAYGSLAAAQVTSPLCRLSLFGPTGSALDSLRSLGSLIKGSEHWH